MILLSFFCLVPYRTYDDALNVECSNGNEMMIYV